MARPIKETGNKLTDLINKQMALEAKVKTLEETLLAHKAELKTTKKLLLIEINNLIEIDEEDDI